MFLNLQLAMDSEGFSLEDSAALEDPDLIAEEIADDLQAALEQFASIAADLRGASPPAEPKVYPTWSTALPA